MIEGLKLLIVSGTSNSTGSTGSKTSSLTSALGTGAIGSSGGTGGISPPIGGILPISPFIASIEAIKFWSAVVFGSSITELETSPVGIPSTLGISSIGIGATGSSDVEVSFASATLEVSALIGSGTLSSSFLGSWIVGVIVGILLVLELLLPVSTLPKDIAFNPSLLLSLLFITIQPLYYKLIIT